MGASRAQGLDPVAILAALGVADVTDTAAITEGEDTAIWRVAHGGQVSALRVMRAEQADAAAREAAAIWAAHAGGIPVAAIERAGTWEGRPAFVLEWLFGYTLASAVMARPWRAYALGRSFGQMQARIHALAAPAPLRAEPDAWLTFIAADEPALAAHLHALEPRTDALLHFDYHPFNVLVGNGRAFDSQRVSIGGARVTGVLDWTNARAGDQRADMAYTATLLNLTRSNFGMSPRREQAARQALLRGWQRGYRTMAGPLPDLAPFYAWAGAFIIRDVAYRLGQPGSMVTPAYLARLRRWTAMWKRRAGIV